MKYVRRLDIKEQAVNAECGGGVSALSPRFSRYLWLGLRLLNKVNIGKTVVF